VARGSRREEDRRTISSTLAAAEQVLAPPGDAGAAMKTVFPDKLRPMSSGTDRTTSPIITSLNAGTGASSPR